MVKRSHFFETEEVQFCATRRSPAKLCRSPSPRTVSPYHRPNVQQAGGGETAVRSDFPSALAIGAGGPDSPAKIIYKSPRKSSPVKQCAVSDD